MMLPVEGISAQCGQFSDFCITAGGFGSKNSGRGSEADHEVVGNAQIYTKILQRMVTPVEVCRMARKR
jgi:hypothetical protein